MLVMPLFVAPAEREKLKKKVYIGETCRNAHLRGNEHMKLLEKESEKSVLYKHIVNEHTRGEKAS